MHSRSLARTVLPLAVTALLARATRANTIDVAIHNLTYTGQNITIALGDTVRWTNLDSLTHTVTEGFVHPPNGSEAFNHSFPPGS